MKSVEESVGSNVYFIKPFRPRSGSEAFKVTTGVPFGVFSGKKKEKEDLMNIGALSLTSWIMM